jgi:hypothetical protein
MASTVTNLLGGNIIDGVSKIISLFKISPEAAAEKQIELQKIQAEMTEAAQKAAQAQIDDATANIQAEAKAGSKARPMFMYIIELVIFQNYVILPAYHLWNGTAIDPFPLPTNLLVLFGVCLTGYTAFDKIMEVMNLPGESTIQIPGVKLGNKN